MTSWKSNWVPNDVTPVRVQSVQWFINQYITEFNHWLYRRGVLEFKTHELKLMELLQLSPSLNWN